MIVTPTQYPRALLLSLGGQRCQPIHLAPHSRHQEPLGEAETLMSHYGPVIPTLPPTWSEPQIQTQCVGGTEP